MTQKVLGEKLDISQQMIGQYGSGVRNPKLATIRKIAEALEVDITEFVHTSNFSSSNYYKKGTSKMQINVDTLVLALHKGSMSQTELSRKSGITRETISRIINSKVDNVNQNTINCIAVALDMKPEALVVGSKDKKILKDIEKKANTDRTRRNYFKVWLKYHGYSRDYEDGDYKDKYPLSERAVTVIFDGSSITESVMDIITRLKADKYTETTDIGNLRYIAKEWSLYRNECNEIDKAENESYPPGYRMKKGQASKLMNCVRNMPSGLHHKFNNSKYDIMKSEIVKWAITQPDLMEYLYQRIKDSGFIKYDQETHTWSGIEYIETQNNYTW